MNTPQLPFEQNHKAIPSTGRIISWFSCGAASAIAAFLCVSKYRERTTVVYCDTLEDEHEDNARFLADVENWLGITIQKISNPKYTNITQVFENRKYVSGPAGAPCTVQLKKVPRFGFQRPDDIHVFGYTLDESQRVSIFENNNPELNLWWPLLEMGLNKDDCFRLLTDHGIKLPRMYDLGFRNNNCIGCVKASSLEYWQRIQLLFPDVFQRRCETTRKFGCKILKVTKNGIAKRFFLDEIQDAVNATQRGFLSDSNENLSCGPQCTFNF
jgi:hypothetical protein